MNRKVCLFLRGILRFEKGPRTSRAASRKWNIDANRNEHLHRCRSSGRCYTAFASSMLRFNHASLSPCYFHSTEQYFYRLAHPSNLALLSPGFIIPRFHFNTPLQHAWFTFTDHNFYKGSYSTVPRFNIALPELSQRHA